MIDYSIQINNTNRFIKALNLVLKYSVTFLDVERKAEIERQKTALSEAVKVFELNAEYEKPNPNRVSFLLKHQAS